MFKSCGLSAFLRGFSEITHEKGLVLYTAATALPLTTIVNLGIITMRVLGIVSIAQSILRVSQNKPLTKVARYGILYKYSVVKWNPLYNVDMRSAEYRRGPFKVDVAHVTCSGWKFSKIECEIEVGVSASSPSESPPFAFDIRSEVIYKCNI